MNFNEAQIRQVYSRQLVSPATILTNFIKIILGSNISTNSEYRQDTKYTTNTYNDLWFYSGLFIEIN